MNTQYTTLKKGFINWLRTLNYSESSLNGITSMIGNFLCYMEENGHTKIKAIKSEHISQYFEYLHGKANTLRGGGLSAGTINCYLRTLRTFQEYLMQNKEIYLPINQKKLPLPVKEIEVLTSDELESLYRACDTSTPLGQLDKMIVSLYYGAGLRRGEGVNLKLEDVDLDGRVLHVRDTKTKRDRMVPIIKPLLLDLREYLLHTRPKLKSASKDNNSTHANYFLMNTKGRKCTNDRVNDRVKLLIQKCDSDTLRLKEANIHRLRHSFASQLLDKGMRMDRIARIIGHQNTQSTTIYTHLNKSNEIGVIRNH